MTSDNHRMMVEMSETVVICTRRLASKLENLVFYHNEPVILCPESFVEKFPFFLFASNTKLFQFVVEVQENVQQRSMTYVCKCKRTCSSVA